MVMQAVVSRAIKEVGYDAERAWLLVRLTSGRIYRYRGVPESEFDALILASSVGRYYNRHIRDAFPYDEIA